MDPVTRELTLRTLPLSQGARERLETFADTVEAMQAPGGAFAGITGTASKAAEQASRIAGVMTLFRNIDADCVSEEDMANGIELATYYLSEALRIAFAASVPEEIAQAELLPKWLVHQWKEQDIVSGEILQYGPNQLRDAKRVERLAGVLEKFGWLHSLPTGTVLRGSKRKNAWRINKPG